MINKAFDFIFNGPEENAPMADWVLWVPLMPIAMAAVFVCFFLFMSWVFVCMFLGIGNDDD